MTTTPPEVTPNLVLIGDSFAGGQYVDEPWHWANAVATATGLELRTYATPNSGIVKKGDNCTGGTFLAKLNSIPVNHPSKIIVEDGIGDRLKCVGTEYVSIATWGEYEDIVEAFMHELALKVVAENMPRDQVYVFTPSSWKVKDYDWTRSIINERAVAHGFTSVTGQYLTVAETVDGFHPDKDGHLRVTNYVLEAMGLAP
jgi:hypothetical protein